MDPSVLVPRPGGLMVEWGWFQFFQLLTFIGHLLFMNTLLGSAIMAFAEGMREGSSTPVGRHVSRKLPTTVALTVNFGVAPLLFMQVLYGQFFYVSDILMGPYWLAVVGLVILAYYGSYIWDFRFDSLGGLRQVILGAVIVLLLGVAFLFTNNVSMMLTPARWAQYFEAPGGTFLNFGEPTLVPRYLHFVVASIAVGGLVQGIYWSRKRRRSLPGAQATAARGMNVFAYATAVQIALGSWWLVSMPRDVMLTFMGGRPFNTAVFLIALALVACCLIFGFRGRVVPAAVALVLTVMAMVGLRELARVAYLEPFYKVAELPSSGQHSPLVMFIVSLCVGLGVIAYVLRLASEVRKEEA